MKRLRRNPTLQFKRFCLQTCPSCKVAANVLTLIKVKISGTVSGARFNVTAKRELAGRF